MSHEEMELLEEVSKQMKGRMSETDALILDQFLKIIKSQHKVIVDLEHSLTDIGQTLKTNLALKS